MDLSLKEAVERIRKEFVLNTEYDKAVVILLEFCEAVLKVKDMPKERDEWHCWGIACNGRDRDRAYNQARADMLAYHTKIMSGVLDVERIEKIVTKWLKQYDTRGCQWGWSLASAIVAELKE